MRSSSVALGQSGFVPQYNNLRHDAKGGSFLLAHQTLGSFNLSTQPADGDTYTFDINGNNVVFTAKTTLGSTAGQVKIGGSAAAFAANLIALLQQPQTTTANGVALSTADQQYLNYLSYLLVGTTLIVSSNNTSLYAALTSFSGSLTTSGNSWTGNTMALVVEPGVLYVGGTRVIYSGGLTPTVTAPTSHPRIDVLTIDNTGTIAWTTGTEAASPSAPSYPANKVPICELYNVVGETALYDNNNQQSSEGYIYNDVRSYLQPSMNWTSFSSDLIPDADGTRNLGSTGAEWNYVYAKTAVYVNGIPIGSGKFGGTGADGALSISSGTTTINCANAAVVVKNYTTISITGSAKLAFSNPNTNGTIVILKSQSGVTLTSSAAPMIDMSGMGAAGGTPVTYSTGGAGTVNGNNGTAGYAQIISTNPGLGSGLAGTAAEFLVSDLLPALLKYPLSWVGAGGASGSVYSSSGVGATSGAGGNGGGGVIVECAGAWNFTTANGISVAGNNGGNGSGGGGYSTGGGGGGGSGGFFLALYGSLTANSGSVTVSGGTGGTPNGNSVATGGGGGSNAHTTGTAGSTNGGNGAAGLAITSQNTEYA